MTSSKLWPLLALAACASPARPPPTAATAARPPAAAPAPAPEPVEPAPSASDQLVEQARQFVADLDPQLRELFVDASVAEWANETDITEAHEAAASKANAAQAAGITRLIKQARAFDPILDKLAPAARRQLVLLKFAGQPAPDDPQQAQELAKLAEEMTSIYGKGVCKTVKGKEQCKIDDDYSAVLQKSHRPGELLAAWQAWHDDIGRAERPLFARYVQLANAGARAIGFANVAAQWRSGYDMPPEAFEADVDRLWGQVEPLYKQLHCYTRRVLAKRYGSKLVPKHGLIPSQLLGNMWGQSWLYLYPMLEPYKGVTAIDVTPALAKHYDAQKMVKMGEAFYTSLGLDPLPESFWQRSQFVQPKDKKVVCHASSWDVTYADDLRLKMCIKPDQEDLFTIHHELGHSYYFHAYYKLPVLFQQGANDGFHEAIGDTIQLSMTPQYLAEKGLLASAKTSQKAIINAQMHVALDKIAFLPFGLLVDKWRWDVFSGKISPAQYNQHWWELKAKYQGVAPPAPRAATDFDPGAKYHVAANVPYMRYFLAAVLEFQFHRALCRKAGFTGPLYQCSIYGNKAAGAAFEKMLALGESVPWQDALYQLTGERDMDASAILEYFAPLQKWLEEHNQGQQCGW